MILRVMDFQKGIIPNKLKFQSFVQLLQGGICNLNKQKRDKHTAHKTNRHALDVNSIFYVRNLSENLSAVIPYHDLLLTIKKETFQISSKVFFVQKSCLLRSL